MPLSAPLSQSTGVDPPINRIPVAARDYCRDMPTNPPARRDASPAWAKEGEPYRPGHGSAGVCRRGNRGLR